MWRGCSPKEKLWLNDVFDIHRNEKTIKRIEEKADRYDLQLKSKADSLMQKELMRFVKIEWIHFTLSVTSKTKN